MIFRSAKSRALVSVVAVSAFAWGSVVPVAAATGAALPTISPTPNTQVANATTVLPGVVSAPPPLATAVASSLRIPEGTEVHIHLNEPLSSATASAGDTFSIVSDEEIRVPDGTVIPAGYSGKGEVTQAEKSGMLGKPGQLSIKLNYLKIGGTHIHLRATKASEGKSNVTTMVVTTVLLSGLGLFIHGHSIIFPKGQPMVAYVDEDSTIAFPLAPPPQLD